MPRAGVPGLPGWAGCDELTLVWAWCRLSSLGHGQGWTKEPHIQGTKGVVTRLGDNQNKDTWHRGTFSEVAEPDPRGRRRVVQERS